MRKRRFTEEQIVQVLHEWDAGAKVVDLIRRHGDYTRESPAIIVNRSPTSLKCRTLAGIHGITGIAHSRQSEPPACFVVDQPLVETNNVDRGRAVVMRI